MIAVKISAIGQKENLNQVEIRNFLGILFALHSSNIKSNYLQANYRTVVKNSRKASITESYLINLKLIEGRVNARVEWEKYTCYKSIRYCFNRVWQNCHHHQKYVKKILQVNSCSYWRKKDCDFLPLKHETCSPANYSIY